MDIKMGIITACSKLLIKSHNYQMQSLSAIFNKYRSERYFNVAVKPLPNSAWTIVIWFILCQIVLLPYQLQKIETKYSSYHKAYLTIFLHLIKQLLWALLQFSTLRFHFSSQSWLWTKSDSWWISLSSNSSMSLWRQVLAPQSYPWSEGCPVYLMSNIQHIHGQPYWSLWLNQGSPSNRAWAHPPRNQREDSWRCTDPSW